MKAFHPQAETIFLEFNGSSQDTALNGVGDVLRVVYRSTGGFAFIKSGIGSQTATEDDLPLVGDSIGKVDYVHIDFKDDHIAILGPNNQNAYITRGSLR